MNKWANGVIAENILSAMDAEQAKIMNQPIATTTLSVCTNIAIASATSPAAAAATTCVGNQIGGSCVQAHLPSSTPDSGPLAPVCNKVDTTESDSWVRINDKKASDAASTYCDNLISAGTVLDSSSTAPAPGTQDDAAENGGSLSLAVLFDAAACDPGTADADQKIDFAALGRDTCYQNLYTSISQYCESPITFFFPLFVTILVLQQFEIYSSPKYSWNADFVCVCPGSQDSTWGDGYNADYTLEGGTVGLSCGLWSLSGDPAS